MRRPAITTTAQGERFRSAWTGAERAVLRRLSTPERLQAWLDELPYRAEESTACPRTVLRERLANCWDGALFAAAALRELGYPPLLLDLRAVRDDDHVLAVFRTGGGWGAVAKSNFVGLRFREPVYRSMRELAMSYFEDYFNADGEKTLRSYHGPFDLRRYDHLRWTFEDAHIAFISDQLDARRHIALVTPGMVGRLGRVDPRSMKAGMVGTDPAGLYGEAERRYARVPPSRNMHAARAGSRASRGNRKIGC